MEKNDVEKTVKHCLNKDFIKSGIIQQVQEEFTFLTYFIKSYRPHNILEIGCKGATFFMFNRFSTGKKIAIDIDNKCLNYLHFFTYDEDFTFINENSQEIGTYDKVKNICDSFDFIFIDGDHSYEGVKRDFELYKNLLSPRGYIGFHDIDPNHIYKDYADGAGQVYKFWQELKVGSKTEIICQKSTAAYTLKDGGFNHGSPEHFGGIGLWQP